MILEPSTYEGIAVDGNYGLKEASLSRTNSSNNPIKIGLYTTVICSAVFITSSNSPTLMTSLQNGNPQMNQYIITQTIKDSSKRLNRQFSNSTLTNGLGKEIEKVISIPHVDSSKWMFLNFNGAVFDQADNKTVDSTLLSERVNPALNKLLENREWFEKKSMNIGAALATLLLISPLFLRELTWGAALPGAIMSISLTGFVWLRRHSRG